MKFPKRLLRLIIRCGQQIVRVATMLGLLLRIMLVKRYNDYRGCVKAAWIASLFGVSRHRVNMERAKLINEGLFRRLPTPQWVKNKYGEWVVLNLKETEPTAPVDNPNNDAEKVEAPPPENLPKLGALDLNQNPLFLWRGIKKPGNRLQRPGNWGFAATPPDPTNLEQHHAGRPP